MSEEKEEVKKAYIEMQNAMINKDMETLNKIIKDDKKFIHMDGKTQTKEEFLEEIRNGTLNYFKSVLKEDKITVTGNKANIKGNTTLTAKVYGNEGEWTLPTDANFEKINGKWVYCD